VAIESQYDSDLLARANEGHAQTQDALAAELRSRGLQPLSPHLSCPVDYDLAWIGDHQGIFLAEIKSLTDANEESQIRYGLGQLLDYAAQLTHGGETVSASYLVLERAPSNPERWLRACESGGAVLGWAPEFKTVL